MITELFLVRHGQTEYNRKKRYCSFTDAPLVKFGKAQVIRLRNKKIVPKPDIIFSSHLKRSRQTARALFPRRQIKPVRALAELNFGRWEGMSYEEIMRGEDSIHYKRWIRNPGRLSPPAGEKMKDFNRRVNGFLAHVLRCYAGKTIACVSHAGPIKIMICRLLGKKKNDFWRVGVGTASVSYFKIKGKKMIFSKLNEIAEKNPKQRSNL
ncbi:MAG: histidine phosphatase family protein [Candidatus Omnitrophota bacterium]